MCDEFKLLAVVFMQGFCKRSGGLWSKDKVLVFETNQLAFWRYAPANSIMFDLGSKG